MMIEEVHLWRGTPSERALRAQLVKSSQFAYFNEQLGQPDWNGKLVFDFGGNRGGLLLDPSCTIRQQDYYCVDVVGDAIKEGRRLFPLAHFEHYDRYNRSFNPEGIVDLPVPDLGVRFDFILAYSVFTHTTLDEMKDLVSQLEALLAPGGALAFTFIDPHWNGNLRWRLERSNAPDVDGPVAAAENAEWCSLINGTELYVNSNGPWDLNPETCATYNVFYTEEFLRGQFPGTKICAPVNDEMQHCAILRKDTKVLR
ncbi:MAG TPA: class I SAM-dependent methyltransferase [Pyrinomonadaceae bacterium]|nr:class I SAM-dependent methyltransferase [Pyrinomonadaceae bacterium]